MHFTLKEILDNTDSKLLFGDIEDTTPFEISTDTRKIQKGNVYLPLRGENYDGSYFIDNAVKLGAIGYLTQDKSKINKSAKFAIYVKNTLSAYLSLALYIRKKINPKVVAITGSSGKTTVKEMLYSVLNTTYKTHKTYLNHNNEIGLCETLFKMPADSEFLVLEMGMRNLGEIELLCKFSEPDASIITNTGCAHVELLGSIENIVKAKCEITSYLKKEGVFIADNDEKIKKTVKFDGTQIYPDIKDCSNIIIEKNKTEFEYKNQKYTLSLEGEHNIKNALLVIECAKHFNVSGGNIKKGLFDFRPIEQRFEISRVKNFNFVNDSYNANPESMKAAIKTFISVNTEPMALVLGDMGELGKDSIKYHKQIGEFLSSYYALKPDIKILTVGEYAKYILKGSVYEGKNFKTNQECADYIVKNLEDESTVLFKASRFMKFEEIIDRVKNL